MKRKALLCALLALILLVPVRPAFAIGDDERGTVIEAVTKLPVIDVVVPASVDILINPLKMPVTIGQTATNAQIVCSPAFILSRSDIPLVVDVSLRGSVYPDSDLQLVGSPTGGTGSSKRAFVYFEMQRETWGVYELAQWDPAYDASKHIVVSDGVTNTKKGIVTLPALPLDYDIYGMLAEDAYAWFRLAGDATKDPASPWNEKDGISVTVTFTFTPQSYD